MSGDESLLKDKHILAVGNEIDIIETILDILDESVIYWARDYKNASKKIKAGNYDFVILDILGVNGRQLLEESVDREFWLEFCRAYSIGKGRATRGASACAARAIPQIFNRQSSIFNTGLSGLGINIYSSHLRKIPADTRWQICWPTLTCR